MRNQDRVVAGINFKSDGPTTVSFRQLYQWVVWQFPRPRDKGFCGAVRPPLTNHHWMPAIIRPDTKKALVYGHVDESFATPEAAAEYFNTINKTK